MIEENHRDRTSVNIATYVCSFWLLSWLFTLRKKCIYIYIYRNRSVSERALCMLHIISSSFFPSICFYFFSMVENCVTLDTHIHTLQLATWFWQNRTRKCLGNVLERQPLQRAATHTINIPFEYFSCSANVCILILTHSTHNDSTFGFLSLTEVPTNLKLNSFFVDTFDEQGNTIYKRTEEMNEKCCMHNQY